MVGTLKYKDVIEKYHLEQRMKKAISIFFILLANIAILTHAVVPHHHHNKVFAAIINILDDDAQKVLNHSHNSETHHHDANPEECAINETVVAATFRLHKDNNIDSGSFDFHSGFDLFAADLTDTVVSGLFVNLPFVPKPYIAGSHTDCIARAIGLRAPPAC